MQVADSSANCNSNAAFREIITDSRDMCLLDVLDDASLDAVLRLLHVRDVCIAACTCRRLRCAVESNTLWMWRLYADMGLSCMPLSAATAALPAAPESLLDRGTTLVPRQAALALYAWLTCSAQSPRTLTCYGMLTDGGCDQPAASFWVRCKG